MHHVGYASLAAAVSNAGGLGTVTALTQRSPELLRAEIRKCASLCPGKPFAVNFTLLPSLAPPDYGAYARVIVEERVPVVETAGRNPGVDRVFQETRRDGGAQVRRDQARADRRAARRGLHKRGRVRVRRAPRRGRRRRVGATRQPPSACACRPSRPGGSATGASWRRASRWARKASTWARGSWPRRRHLLRTGSKTRWCAATNGPPRW